MYNFVIHHLSIAFCAELPDDPTTPLLGCHLKNLKIFNHKNICITMIIATLFTVAKHGNNQNVL